MSLRGSDQLNRKPQSSQKGRVDIARASRGEDDDRTCSFDSIEEKIHALARISIVGVFHRRALAEERVGLIEKEYCSASFRRVKKFAQVFFRLARVPAVERTKVDAVQLPVELGRYRFGETRPLPRGLANHENSGAGGRR